MVNNQSSSIIDRAAKARFRATNELTDSVGPTLAETQMDLLSAGANLRGSKLSCKSMKHNLPVREVIDSEMRK